MDIERTGAGRNHEAEIAPLWREHRTFLVDLAFKMLGNFSDAEDVVQDAFSRLLRADLDAIEDVRGWLVVVVSRLCLDDLRSARARRVDLGTDWDAVSPAPVSDPADRITLDDNIRMALLVVLQRLSPAERAVFVLHDVFGFPFATAATIVGRSPEACRQLATRARRRIESDAGAGRFLVQPPDEHRVVERFIAACAGGDLTALMELLDPDVVGDVDLGPDDVRPVQVGRDAVGSNLLRFLGGRSGTTLVSHPTNGRLGALAFRDRKLFAVVTLELSGDLVRDIHAMADPRKLELASLQFRATD